MTRSEAEQKQFIRMTETPVPRLITSLAIPTIFTMLIGAFYNMADTFFVARLGTSAAGAVGIVFAIMAIIQALGFMIGIGTGSHVPRFLGRQNRKEADKFASTGFFLSLLFGGILTAIGLLFTEPLMILLGATPTILPYARDYAGCIFMGAVVMCGSIVMNNILRSEGKAVLSTIGLGFGGILNVGLDPLFIFQFGLGISGAAIATLISQCVSFGILLYWFSTGKSITRLSWSNLSRKGADYADILKLGFSSFCRQGLAGISTVALNVSAAAYGDSAVAAMSIVGRIFYFLLAMLIGFGQGFQPVVGYNYGAKRFERVKESFRFCVKTGTVFLTGVGILGFLFAPQLIQLFKVNDPSVAAIGAMAFRAQCIALPLQATIVLSNMLFQSIGKALQATLISATRQGIYFIPLILILPRYFGLTGIEFTQSISDLFSFLSALPFLYFFFRSLNRAMRERAPAGEEETPCGQMAA